MTSHNKIAQFNCERLAYFRRFSPDNQETGKVIQYQYSVIVWGFSCHSDGDGWV